jgi:hypothetical protein
MPPTTRKAPQDRLSKAVDGFTFKCADGKTHVLPWATTARTILPGRYLRDAAMDGIEGQMRLIFASLEAVDADPATIEALYDLPADDMLKIAQDWFNTPGPDGVSAPQS